MRTGFHRTVAYAFPLLLLCLGGTTQADDKGKLLTPEEVLNISWVVRPVVSPDGRRVLYSVIETVNGARRTTIRISDVKEHAKGESVLSGFDSVSHVRWSQNGKRLAFAATHEGVKGRQLFVAKADASEPRCLTNLENGVAAFRWAPDSTAIAFTADERIRIVSTIVVDGGDAPRHALWTVDLDGGSPRKVTSNEQHIIDFDWSTDGSEFAVLLSRWEPGTVAAPPASLQVLRRADGATVRTLSDAATTGCDIAWSPDGKTIAAAVFAPRKISRRLALFPAAGGEPTFPFQGYRATPMSHVEWSVDSRFLYVQSMDKTRNRLMRFDVSDNRRIDMAPELVNFWDYSLSRDGSVAAFSAESQHDPPDLFIKEHDAIYRMTDFNPQLKEFALGNVKSVEWKSSLDGRAVYGVLIAPPSHKAGKPCPTIVNLHSGPHWLWWEGWVGTWMSWGQYLASNGYAVFMPNHRGSLGQGWEFAEAHYLEWGRGDYQDVMDGVDMLVDQGIADPQRLGIGGGSFGGYLTAWTITQTNRFKAAVVDAGWTDLVSSNLAIDVPEPLRLYLNGTELEQTERYRSRSPLTFVGQCRTPTLILHGENDRRVPTDQGRMFHRALQLHGVASQLVLYKGEGHGLAKREHQLDSLRRVKQWFDRHLVNDFRFDGVWKPKEATLGGVLLPPRAVAAITLKIDGGNYEVTVEGEDHSDKGRFTLDTSVTPHRMTINSSSGPSKGKTILAIYEIKGSDAMRVCYDLSGKEFPKEFKAPKGTELYLVGYRRQGELGPPAQRE